MSDKLQPGDHYHTTCPNCDGQNIIVVEEGDKSIALTCQDCETDFTEQSA